MEEFETKLAQFTRRLLGGDDAPANLNRLTGGANLESWSFDHGGRGYVLRRSDSADRRYRITEGAEEIQMRKVAGHLFGFMG